MKIITRVCWLSIIIFAQVKCSGKNIGVVSYFVYSKEIEPAAILSVLNVESYVFIC